MKEIDYSILKAIVTNEKSFVKLLHLIYDDFHSAIKKLKAGNQENLYKNNTQNTY